MITEQELDRMLDAWEVPEPPPALRGKLAAALPPRRRTFFGIPLRWAAVCGAAAIPVAVATSVYDPSGRIGGESTGASFTPHGAVFVRTTRFVSPASAAVRWLWKGDRFSVGASEDGSTAGLAVIHDRFGARYYGFEYSIRPAAHGHFEIAVGSLDISRLERGPYRFRGEIVPLPERARTVTVADGGAADIEVFRSPAERVFIRMEVASRAFPGAFREPPLQTGQLRLFHPKLIVNGTGVSTNRGWSMGSTVWVRLPGGAGRYVLTTDPAGNPAFAPNGSIHGNTVEFAAGADRVRIECEKEIAASGGPLYVYHDESFGLELKPGEPGPLFGSAGPPCYFRRCF